MDRKITQLFSGFFIACIACVSQADLPEPDGLEGILSVQKAVPELVSRHGVFEEPLVPFGVPKHAETEALAIAVEAYKSGGDRSDVAVLKDFLSDYPENPWRVSLLLNMGLARKQGGFYTDAISLLEQAHEAGAIAGRLEEKAVAARALGELLSLHTRLGHKEAIAKYLKGVSESPETGSVSEMIAQAKEGLWQIENTPEEVLICGLQALDTLLSQHSSVANAEPRFLDVKASKNGINLATLKALAAGEGATARIVKRSEDQPFPVPSVMHLKVGHYTTVLQEKEGRYEVFDPTLDQTLWFSRDAMEAESSGNFLVLQKDKNIDAEQWALVDDIMAQTIFGAGNTGSNEPSQTSSENETDGGDSCSSSTGMPRYQVHSMLVSLNIVDTPLIYTPPKGPAVPITLSYNHREAYQPTTFTFGNLGQKWLFNWTSYVRDDPQNTSGDVRLYLRGGGSRVYRGYNSGTGSYDPDQRGGAILTRVANAPIQYERVLANGMRQVYTESDGSTFYPRHILLSKIIDTSGNEIELGYDDHQRLVSLTDALGQVTHIHYEHPSNPLLITGATDPSGRGTIFHYDNSGRLNSIIDAEGMTSTFAYSSGSTVSAMTTPYGTTQFSAGTSGNRRWIQITDPKGERERVEYRHVASGIPFSDSPVPAGMSVFNRYINYRNTFYWDKEAMKRAPGDYTQASIRHWLHWRFNGSYTTGVLESTKNPLERRVWFSYPNQPSVIYDGTLDKPSVIGRVLPDGTTRLEKRSYNSRGNVIVEIDPLGREMRYEYAANDIDLERILRKTASGFETLAEFTYNSQHQPLTYTGPDGQLYVYTYNAANQLLTVTNPLSQVIAYNYNDDGYLQGITDANDVSLVTYTYDSIGRRVSETNAVGYRLEYAYDDLNRLVERRYPDDTSDIYTWDKLDMVSMTDRYGNTTQHSYDAVRNRIATLDPSDHPTNYDYFADGELQVITDGKGNSTEYERDIQSRIVKTLRPDSSFHQTAYDNNGRQAINTDPMGGVTRFGYDRDDKLNEITDPNGNATQYNYDAYTGLLTQQVSPDTGVTRYDYDSNNNLISQTDAKGQATAFSYDDLNRIEQVDYSDGQSVAYQYDVGSYGTGRLGEIAEDDVTSRFVYDSRGNIIQLTQEAVNGPSLSAQYSFTPAGNLAQVIYPSGAVVDYEYVNDRLSKIMVDEQTVLEHIQYEAFGPMKSWQWGNGQIHSRSYDAAGLLASFSLDTDTRTLAYDPQNNIKGITDSQINQDFVYDDLDRLTEAQAVGTDSEQNYSLAYSYDANGNRIAAEVAGVNETYTIEGTSNRLIDVGGAPKAYDANGNMIDDGTHTYQYDARNRLVSVDNGATGIYEYNALGQRIYKKQLRQYQLTADLNSDGEVNQEDIHFLDDLIKAGEHPDFADLTLDGIVDKQDNACVATEIGGKGKGKGPKRCHVGEWVEITVESAFLYQGPNLLGEYENTGRPRQELIWMGNTPVAVLQGGQLYQIHSDHLDTPVVITDSSNTIVWRWDRRPFGDMVVMDDPDGDGQAYVFNPRFPGQYFDEETGTHYNYFRIYDPSIGRYTQSDPIGLRGGLNDYAYVYNNPIMFYDPYGLWAIGDPLPQGAVDFSAGLGDALLLGFGDDLRELAGVGGVNECSGAYQAGGWVSFGFGGARLAYAGLAKGGSMLASSGAAASAFRANLKIAFRGRVGKNWRPPNLAGKSDAQLRRSAGKTNFGVNAYGAGVAGAGAAGGSGCGCEN